MTSRYILIRDFLILVFLVPFLFLSCEKNAVDDPDDPLELELLSTDFITPTEVSFTADIFGDMTLVDGKGFCWSTNPSPDVFGSFISSPVEIGIFKSGITGLNPDTRYYVRAFYRVGTEVYYSEQLSFETPVAVSDAQGNQYKTVKIGRQLWMAENLKTKVYRNGNQIQDGTGLANYSAMSQPKLYFNYADDMENADAYGRLYTWYAISDDRGVCPAGWRVPDIIDWQKLSKHLDILALPFSELGPGQSEISSVVGGMLKQTGTLGAQTGLWESPNSGATNESRLGIIPGGFRDPSGAFSGLGFNGAFWSFTATNNTHAEMFYAHFFNAGFYTNTFSKNSGYSVRCMKDF